MDESALKALRECQIRRMDAQRARRAGEHVQEPKVKRPYEVSRATTSR